MYRMTFWALLALAPSAQVPPQVHNPELIVTCDPATCSHRYVNGNDFIILESPEARLAVAVDRVTLDHHFFSITVAVTNNGDRPIDVVPSKAWLGVDTPKKEEISSVDPEIVATANHGIDYATVMKIAMQANTIDKGQDTIGTIFFKADKKAQSAHLVMTVGLHIFYVPLTLLHPR